MTVSTQPGGSQPGARRTARLRQVLLIAAVGVVAPLLALVPAAQAQDRCARIQNELASLVNGGGGPGGQLRDAINQQNRELARARGAYDRLGCGSFASGQCASVISAINQMQANIATMQRQLQRAGGGGSSQRIRELERVFATQCGPGQRQVQAASQPEPRPRSLLAAIFGTRATPQPQDPSAVVLPPQPAQRGFDRPGREQTREPVIRTRGGTYRTMCVRTTDGFYWPISFSTTRDRFDEDQGLCAAMCPGTSVELFAYRNPGETVDAMISTMSGESYATQQYAFAYRTDFDPDNRCTPSAMVLDDLRRSTGLMDAEQRPRVPQPAVRPALEADPETRALDAAGIDFPTLAAIAASGRGSSRELVRVVGPAYGYFTE